ncbi:MAG: hypothetical protein M1434_10555 [Chloroflexi bacterium]|nr:hypothetical protein [Chloroflexota bacterium]MCL5275167.1 hypothetical protein [Chloroflexota bacterium]
MRLFPVILRILAPQFPLFVAWIVAIILAFVTWKRHPAVSLLTLIAVVLFILGNLFNLFILSVLPVELGISVRSLGVLLGVGRIFTIILETCGWALVIAAIFGWRKRTEPQG